MNFTVTHKGSLSGTNKYNVLYNHYVVSDVRNIANTGWHVPTRTEYDTLITYLGGNVDSGIKMMEAGTSHWINGIGTNTSGFTAMANGYRQSVSGAFLGLNNQASWWTSTLFNALKPWSCDLLNDGYCETQYMFNGLTVGYAVRLLKDSTVLTNGQTGTYTGNNNKVYNSICIGTQEWLSEALMETKYRNGSVIPEITGNAAWGVLTTGGMCVYNNDWNYVWAYNYVSPLIFTVHHVLVCGLIDGEMKYLQSINLPGGGVTTSVTTSLVTGQEPYNLFLLEPITGGQYNDISSSVLMTLSNPVVTGGVYIVYIYNGGAALTGVKLKILY